MTMQIIKLGELPSGAGGDTNRSASVKCNENFTELYSRNALINGELDLLHKATKWLDGHKANTGINRDITELAGLETPLSIKQGGTGANQPIEACRAINALALGRSNPSISTSLDSSIVPGIAHIKEHYLTPLTISNGGNNWASTVMSFHRMGAFRCHFGLDVDNHLKVGGGSFGARSFRIYHEGNTTRAADGTLKAI